MSRVIFCENQLNTVRSGIVRNGHIFQVFCLYIWCMFYLRKIASIQGILMHEKKEKYSLKSIALLFARETMVESQHRESQVQSNVNIYVPQ